MSDTVPWAGISDPLSSSQITTMVSFSLFWVYCRDLGDDNSVVKAEAVKAYLRRICVDLPSADDWSTVMPEHQQCLMTTFGRISSSEKMLREAVGFLRQTAGYNQIKSAYAELVGIILSEQLDTNYVGQEDPGYFITQQSGVVVFSLFYQEIKRLETEERYALQRRVAKEIIDVFRGDAYSRIKLVYILLVLASGDEGRRAGQDQAGYIASLDDIDEEEVAGGVELRVTDELRAALEELARSLLEPQSPLPVLSMFCAEQLLTACAGATQKARENAELALVTSTENQILSDLYRERIRDTLSIRGGTLPSGAKAELIERVVRNTNTVQLGIFYHQGEFFFSEDVFLTVMFAAEIRSSVVEVNNTQRLDRSKLKVGLGRYFPESRFADFPDIRVLLAALDGNADADIITALIDAARQRPYLQELLGLPFPGLERCRDLLLQIIYDPKHGKLQNTPYRLQNMHRFSQQGLVDYLKVSLDKGAVLCLNVQGKMTPVSVLDALKANASSVPVYTALAIHEIALYATPDESYGLIYQAASIIEDQQEDAGAEIEALLVLLAAIRRPEGISVKNLGMFRSVTPQKLVRLFTDKLNFLADKKGKNTFRASVSTILAGLQRALQLSVSERDRLREDEARLLSVVAKGIRIGATLPPVGWFVPNTAAGEVIYTLDAQRAIFLATQFINFQEEGKYNQLAEIEDFPSGLLIGDIRWLTIAGLFLQGRIEGSMFFLEREMELPPFSPLVLKQWANFVRENATQDFVSLIGNNPLLKDVKNFLVRKDVQEVAQNVIEGLAVVSSKWPREIDKIQEMLQPAFPALLVFEDAIFYNELDFWTAIFKQRLARAQSVSDISVIITEMLPEEIFDAAGVDSYPVEGMSGADSATDNRDGVDGYETVVLFLGGNIPTFSQLSAKVLRETPSEIDIGWLYEKSKSFQPFFSLLVHLLRIHGVTLSDDSSVWLQKRLSYAPESNRVQGDTVSEDVLGFKVGIDPRRLNFFRIGTIPPIYYNTNYLLSEEEIVAVHLNSLLNPQMNYPYDAGFAQVDWFKLLSFGSLEAIRQILSQVLCCPFSDFPEKYPLAVGLGFKNTWRQVVEVMGAFLRVSMDSPDLLRDLFRSCFPKEQLGTPERVWFDHSLAVMLLMLLWIKSKRQSTYEDHLTYALAGLWHNLGMIEFGGAFDPAKGNLKGREHLFTEYLTHQRGGFAIFNAAWDQWFTNGDGSPRLRKAIGDVILYHHARPRNSAENSIIQEIDDLVAVSYIADSVVHATLSVMRVHAKGASFETIFDRMLINLSRSDSGKFHLPVKIRELFPAFCGLMKSAILQKAKAA